MPLHVSQCQPEEYYSKYSCHELNYFLFHKDFAFFTRVVVPFIHNKLQPTFFDLALMGADVSSFLHDKETQRFEFCGEIDAGTEGKIQYNSLKYIHANQA